jgi:hypothetical protein
VLGISGPKRGAPITAITIVRTGSAVVLGA